MQRLVEGLRLGDRYVLQARIASGGMADVWRGLDDVLKRDVAVKVMRADPDNEEIFAERFRDEALHSAALLHPNITTVFDYGEDDHLTYLVMEYCEGRTLTQHLQQHGGRLRYSQMLDIMMPVLAALESVHAENIFHRDVSPDNILVTDEGVKLIDFGAARAALSDRSVSFSTIVRQDYAPPEQYSRRGRQGPWSDIYAAAATMYHGSPGQVSPRLPSPALCEAWLACVVLPPGPVTSLTPASNCACSE